MPPPALPRLPIDRALREAAQDLTDSYEAQRAIRQINEHVRATRPPPRTTGFLPDGPNHRIQKTIHRRNKRSRRNKQPRDYQPCGPCGKTYPNQDAFNQHLRTRRHILKAVWVSRKCQGCNQHFYSPEEYRKHSLAWHMTIYPNLDLHIFSQ